MNAASLLRVGRLNGSCLTLKDEMKFKNHTIVGLFSGAMVGIWCVFFSPMVDAATFDTFTDTKESCDEWAGVRYDTCYDLVSDIELEPVNGGMRVTWVAGSWVHGWRCGSSGAVEHFCPFEGQRAVSTFDPVTRTGGTSCTPDASTPRSCVVSGLTNGVQYRFLIETSTKSNLGDCATRWCNTTPFRTLYTNVSASPCCSVAASPSGVQATQVGAALDVTWAASMDWGGATTLKYVVTTDPPSVSCSSEVLTCRLEGLDYAKTYKVLVASKNDAGESAPVAGAATYTIPTGPPDSPTISSVKFGVGKGAKVSWVAPERTGGLPVKKYTATAHPGGATCSTTGAQTCTIAGLSAGKSYSFTATASNSKGMSKASALSVAGKLTGPGVLVRSPIATASGTAATVTWQTPSSSAGGALVTYVVKASGNGGTCSTKNTSCRILGLRPGGTYEFAVKTVRTGGASAPVSTVAITMPAPAIPEPPKPTQVLS